jgi:hypothetical protein
VINATIIQAATNVTIIIIVIAIEVNDVTKLKAITISNIATTSFNEDFSVK